MCDRECVAGVIHSCVFDPKQRIQRACYLQSGGFGSRVDYAASPRLFDVITVANRLDCNENATFEYEAPHQLAGTEVVDVLGYDDLLRDTVRRVTTFRTPATGVAAAVTDVKTAQGVAEVTHRGRLAANGNDLLFVHAVANEFVFATKRVRGIRRKHRDDQ